MAANTGALAGRTIFITGASRGIGQAIALKAARDGANIVIAAKTAEPHPKLPGTIYTVAKEVESVGGKCLPCIVDIRSEEQVKAAVDQAVKEFGGIDVLINNASAIHLTGTVETPMKRYDLMHSINTRGTFLCSKYCIPHLKNGKNPHIMNISPPLSMSAKWFSAHVAYTMAKYGMSMCALGMADEFKEFGVAVNTLWPRTAIYTAAMEMLGGGEGIKDQCRTPEIMCDAAYSILCKDSKTFTGNFCIDEDILRGDGVTDFEKYSCVPGSTLLPDFFLEDEEESKIQEVVKSAGSSAKAKDSDAPIASGKAAATFRTIESLLSEDLVKSIGGIFQFDIKGAEEGTWFVDLKNGSGSLGQGEGPNKASCTMTMDTEDFVKMFSGQLKPTAAFMAGKLKITGDLSLAMKLESLMGQMQSKM